MTLLFKLVSICLLLFLTITIMFIIKELKYSISQREYFDVCIMFLALILVIILSIIVLGLLII